MVTFLLQSRIILKCCRIENIPQFYLLCAQSPHIILSVCAAAQSSHSRNGINTVHGKIKLIKRHLEADSVTTTWGNQAKGVKRGENTDLQIKCVKP